MSMPILVKNTCIAVFPVTLLESLISAIFIEFPLTVLVILLGNEI